VAGGIGGRLARRGVRIAVDLDDEVCFRTEEIGQTAADDKPPDRMLSPDLEAQPPVAHDIPDLRFRRRQRMAETAGALERGGAVKWPLPLVCWALPDLPLI